MLQEACSMLQRDLGNVHESARMRGPAEIHPAPTTSSDKALANCAEQAHGE